MDPLNPSVWYNVMSRDLKDFQKGYEMIASYHGGHVPALMRFYPNIGLTKNRFNFALTRKKKLGANGSNYEDNDGSPPLVYHRRPKKVA